nr:hypothetical protein [Tanacetum cinerariifolium]
MNDSLKRAATTATSLDAEQEKGNISKTQSKVTPDVLRSYGTDFGGSPKCQEAMRDTVAQTRSETVSKVSNDPLLIRVNTTQSGEDSLQNNELMDFCTNLKNRALDLETTKTTQAMEIESLKRRVKKLEKKQRSRTYKLKRIYKVGLLTRVESSKDEGLGKEDASKQEMIANIDSIEDIYLVNVHKDKDIFGVIDSDGDEVIVEDRKRFTAATTPTISIDEATLAQELAELKHAKPKAEAKGIVFHKLEESTITTAAIPKSKLQKRKAKMIEEVAKIDTDYELAQRLQEEEQDELTDAKKAKLFMEFLEKRRKFFATKRAEEKRNIPPTRAQQRTIMCTNLKNMDGWKLKSLKKKSFAKIQELFDKGMKRMNTFVDYKTKLLEESSKKAEIEITQEGKKSYFQIFRADGNSKIYSTFRKMLKIFDKEDLEVIWRLVKDRFENVKHVDNMDSFLLHNLKTMFEHHVEDNNILYYLLVEKMYPLTNHTLHQMFNDVKLQIDYKCEVAFELLRLVKK